MGKGEPLTEVYCRRLQALVDKATKTTTQRELARRMGIDESSVSAYANGNFSRGKNFQLETIEKHARGLGVTPADLFREPDDQEEEKSNPQVPAVLPGVSLERAADPLPVGIDDAEWLFPVLPFWGVVPDPEPGRYVAGRVETEEQSFPPAVIVGSVLVIDRMSLDFEVGELYVLRTESGPVVREVINVEGKVILCGPDGYEPFDTTGQRRVWQQRIAGRVIVVDTSRS